MQTRRSGVVECWSDGVRGKPSRSMAGLPAGHMAGFTLIELLVSIALGLIILAGLFRTFKVQQDSYVIQDQVSAMQQNLRAAMYMITRDLQMAGYYTNYDHNQQPRDWNADGNNETGLPLLFASNNVTASGDNIKDGTDVIVIVKASLEEGRPLKDTELATGGTIQLGSWDLDGAPGPDLNTTGKRYGVLVKSDLYKAELFQLDSSGNLIQPLKESYAGDTSEPLRADRIHRADIIIYKVDDTNPTRPVLKRRNLGQDTGDFEVLAENIDNLQFTYQLQSGQWVNDPNDPAGNQNRVRAVEVFLVGRTAYTQRGYMDSNTYSFGSGATASSYTPTGADRQYRRKVLTSIVKTRNIGLD